MTTAAPPVNVYLYRRLDNDELVEVPMTLEQMFARQDCLGRITLDIAGVDGGVEAQRDTDAEDERGGRPTRRSALLRKHNGAGWPLVSDAFGVHPSQVDDANKTFSRVHPGIEFKNNGQAVFHSRGARRAAIKHAREHVPALRGLHDRDGGYGDG